MSKPRRQWDDYMMRLRHLVTVVMTWRCSWFVQCSACSPMTPASSSRATSFWNCWRPGPAKTAPTSAPALARLFQVLNTPVDRRQAKLDEDLARFPYVNGDLFAATLNITDFDADDAGGSDRRLPFRLGSHLTRHLRCALPVRDGTPPSAAPRAPTTPPRKTS